MPPPAVTVILTVPEPAGATTVSSLADTTLIEVPFLALNDDALAHISVGHGHDGMVTAGYPFCAISTQCRRIATLCIGQFCIGFLSSANDCKACLATKTRYKVSLGMPRVAERSTGT